LAVAASILSKNKAILEFIKGTQKLREVIPKKVSNKILNDVQKTKATKKLVQNVKTKLKLKGEI